MGQGPSVQGGETTQMPRRFKRDQARSFLTYMYFSIFLHQIYFLFNFCNVSLDVYCCRAVEIYGRIYVKSTLKTVKHYNGTRQQELKGRMNQSRSPVHLCSAQTLHIYISFSLHDRLLRHQQKSFRAWTHTNASHQIFRIHRSDEEELHLAVF